MQDGVHVVNIVCTITCWIIPGESCTSGFAMRTSQSSCSSGAAGLAAAAFLSSDLETAHPYEESQKDDSCRSRLYVFKGSVMLTPLLSAF